MCSRRAFSLQNPQPRSIQQHASAHPTARNQRGVSKFAFDRSGIALGPGRWVAGFSAATHLF
jgi:hypothetical protein